MTISPGLLELIIVAAIALAAVAPVVLLLMWLCDRKGGKLW